MIPFQLRVTDKQFEEIEKLFQESKKYKSRAEVVRVAIDNYLLILEPTAEVRHPIDMNGIENKKVNYCFKCGTNIKNQIYCHMCGRKLIWNKSTVSC